MTRFDEIIKNYDQLNARLYELQGFHLGHGTGKRASHKEIYTIAAEIRKLRELICEYVNIRIAPDIVKMERLNNETIRDQAKNLLQEMENLPELFDKFSTLRPEFMNLKLSLAIAPQLMPEIKTENNCRIYRDYTISPSNFFNYEFSHKDYDGPEDNRCGYAKTLEEALDTIDEQILESEKLS